MLLNISQASNEYIYFSLFSKQIKDQAWFLTLSYISGFCGSDLKTKKKKLLASAHSI